MYNHRGGETMRILLVSPESKVWNSRAHIHNGLGYLAGSLLANGYTDVTLHDGAVEDIPVAQVLDKDLAKMFSKNIVDISEPIVLIKPYSAAVHKSKALRAITIMGL